MRQQLVARRLVAVLAVLFALSPSVSFGSFGFADPSKDNGTWGFEIGNGRQLIRNTLGKYNVNIPGRWEAGLFDKITEVIAPLNEGTPRSSLQIKVLDSEGVTTPTGMLQSKDDWGDWSRVEIAGLLGIKRETPIVLSQAEKKVVARKIDIELLRDKDIFYITLYGREGKPEEQTSLRELYRSVMSMQVVQ